VHAVGCEYVKMLVVVRKSRPKHVLILDSQWPDQLGDQCDRNGDEDDVGWLILSLENLQNLQNLQS
jgi:hypothetical protein